MLVTWQQAADFCRWLSKKEGQPYRLPTEAEWEYACRAGTTTAFYTGDTLDCRRRRTSAWTATAIGGSATVAVGSTRPNAWGLFDMHGNVEEWCLDWYGPYEAGEQTDPVGRADGDVRVTRGGSYNLHRVSGFRATPAIAARPTALAICPRTPTAAPVSAWCWARCRRASRCRRRRRRCTSRT